MESSRQDAGQHKAFWERDVERYRGHRVPLNLCLMDSNWNGGGQSFDDAGE